MQFIRENIIKIVVFIIIFIIAMVVFIAIFSGREGMNSKSYQGMEQQMVNSTKKYLNKNNNLYPKENEVSKITLDTLENFKYIKTLHALEDENVKCNGYVEIIYKNKGYVYVPYLKCGKYYETKTLANYIKDNEIIVTSGDGLYQVGDKFVYRGENPNNYVGIGNRLYRIIDIEENELKLISVKKLEDYIVWDDRYNVEKQNNYGINDYTKSRLKEYLEKLLTNTNENNSNYFSNSELEKMVPHDVCIGKRSLSNGTIDTSIDCQTVDPNQKVSLISVSDYARASIDPNCRTIFDNSCVNYNYFSTISSNFRTITATSDNTYQVFTISDGVAELTRSSSAFSPAIVIYINALSLYKSGNGTLETPYTIR